jgi:hypothetical protein
VTEDSQYPSGFSPPPDSFNPKESPGRHDPKELPHKPAPSSKFLKITFSEETTDLSGKKRIRSTSFDFAVPEGMDNEIFWNFVSQGISRHNMWPEEKFGGI